MKKVTGIGGIFFKADNPEDMRKWYENNLGLSGDEYGITFEWRKKSKPEESGYSVMSLFKKDTKYFEPSAKEFMLNLRVENLDYLLGELKKSGVEICDEIMEEDYGKFVHIIDPEGNKIELWQPVDKVFDGLYKDKAISE